MVATLKELDTNWESLTFILKANTNKAFFNFKSNKDILSSILIAGLYLDWNVIRSRFLERSEQDMNLVTSSYTGMVLVLINIKWLSRFASCMKKEEGGTKEGHLSFQSLYIRESERPKSWKRDPVSIDYLKAVTELAFRSMQQDANKPDLKKMIGDHFVKNRKKYSTTLKLQKKVSFGSTVSPHSYKRLATKEDSEYLDDCLNWMLY
jgi:hypothetical protein